MFSNNNVAKNPVMFVLEVVSLYVQLHMIYDA